MGLCGVRRARVTTAKGPNALPFGTPGATDVAQALRFVASPLVRAAALPAPLVGAEGGNGRKVLRDKTNTPRIMPAPAVSSAIRKIRGKARSRTHTPSEGAEAQRRRRLL